MDPNQNSNKKIYINPNFPSHNRNICINNRTDSIHINPNFAKSSSVIPLLPSRVCYVNPRIFSQIPQNPSTALPEIPQNPILPEKSNNYLVHSKTKIVKIANAPTTSEKKPAEEVIVKPVVPRKPSYKVVRNNSTNCKPISSVPLTEPKITSQASSHFPKLKNEVVNQPNPFTKINKSNLSRKSLTSTKSPLSSVKTSVNSPFKSVIIGGEKFMSLPDKLVKVKSSPVNKTKLTKKVLINGSTYIRKSANLFVLENANKSYKKTNIVCPKYVKTGKCKKYELGKCLLVHNPKHITVCKKYLRGMCKIEDCSLSHNVTLEKMPTCKFFLEGCCTRDQCPYLHVKVGENVKLCSQFIKGFCPQGKECQLKHLNICPKFYESSKCDDKHCKLPHTTPNTTVDSPKLVVPNYNSTVSIPKKVVPLKLEEENCAKSSRYFEDSTECDKKPDTSGIENEKKYDLSNRPKIGKLPSFISLD